MGVKLADQMFAKIGIDYVPHADAGTFWQFATHPRLQGMGLGTRLITEGERRIRRRGLGWAILGVEDNNPRARALYERLGYVPWRRERASWQEEDEHGSPRVCETEVVLLRKHI
jgi:ribosomal protein S18 acetylase RimI-like enzyme